LGFDWFEYVQEFDLDFARRWIGSLAGAGLRTTRVLDPFAGSGTTLLACLVDGNQGVGVEISPYMAMAARARTNWDLDLGVAERHLSSFSAEAAPIDGQLSPRYEQAAARLFAGDPLLRRWVAAPVAARVLRVRDLIFGITDEPQRQFFLSALGSIIPSVSNMEYRPNISYKRRPVIDAPVASAFVARCREMLADLRTVRTRVRRGSARVVEGDARRLGILMEDEGPFDLIFTSPPYPNDMEYVHQTRMELLLLGFAGDRSGLTDLKKRMITSSVKLVYTQNRYQVALGMTIPGVAEVSDRIAKTLEGRGWGWNPAQMTAEYFGGMRLVLEQAFNLLRPGGQCALIVGDSAFNGVKVPTDQLLGELGRSVGFTGVRAEPFRSRNNSKHDTALQEAVVVLIRD
jgi:16S rRNA G966 N2-methylase RsmD